jgi:hypothetical protein
LCTLMTGLHQCLFCLCHFWTKGRPFETPWSRSIQSPPRRPILELVACTAKIVLILVRPVLNHQLHNYIYLVPGGFMLLHVLLKRGEGSAVWFDSCPCRCASTITLVPTPSKHNESRWRIVPWCIPLLSRSTPSDH